MPIREEKPRWSDVPREVRAETERRLGSRVTRATRAYGGYAASATFRLQLANGHRAFFKAGYPPPPGSAAIFPIDREERRRPRLAPGVGRWAPRFLGSFHLAGRAVLRLQDPRPPAIPPWAPPATRRAAPSCPRGHRS